MIRTRFAFALAAAMVWSILSLAAAAQPGPPPGQYVILSAQYGTARRHVDVTKQLRHIANQDRPFRMGNSTFGIDPDPGHRKVLRIYARDPRGQERMFEYREGSTVDGAMFAGWRGGNWGGGGWSGHWDAPPPPPPGPGAPPPPPR